MSSNVGNLDRILRILGGILIIGWGIYAQNWVGVLGIVPLSTGLAGWCPVYSLLGLNTCSGNES
ncbi:hypothetical protein CH373_02125 [Leptospira perolatii]|uniref:Inner membrane protein YgaP-like transmembrane domain-containing protein n=1 Tax=Leptospira perolatii TaxID=2023191 RepID=A0A2M9ZRY8_9LEPT|nr:DUF2892 domain-containing protein [Leptospira perolatii]PJZ71323.1 hypothetical protein CH360_02125 [Leptospira perolatii]PJZ74857.1 hypothetical protein CH373_02125 [Leptospira perolatii]